MDLMERGQQKNGNVWAETCDGMNGGKGTAGMSKET